MGLEVVVLAVVLAMMAIAAAGRRHAPRLVPVRVHDERRPRPGGDDAR